MPEPVRTALYLYLAREDTSSRRLLATQHDAVRAAAQTLGWYVVDVFSDTGPGHSRDRSGLQTMLAAAHARRFDVVLVNSITDLAQGLPDLFAIVSALHHAGIRLRSATEPIDTATPAGRTLLNLLAAFAQPDHRTLAGGPSAGPGRATGPAQPARQQPPAQDPSTKTRHHHAKPSRLRRFVRYFVRHSRSDGGQRK